MIKLTVRTDHLSAAVRIADIFRSSDESRPILNAMLVRIRGEKGRERMEWIATDSYRAVKLTTPYEEVSDSSPDDVLRGQGVMISLPYSEMRRFNAALRKSLSANFNATLTISTRGENGAFGLTSTGAWNGRGCYLTATEADLPIVVAGETIGGVYPNVDSLWPSKFEVALSRTIAWNPVYIADFGLCAEALVQGPKLRSGSVAVPLKLVHATDPLKPALFTASYEGREMQALLMPVRVA